MGETVQWIVVGCLVVGSVAVLARLVVRRLRPSPGMAEGCLSEQCRTCKHLLAEAERGGGCALGRVPEDASPDGREAD